MTPLSYISPKATVRDSPIHGRGLFAVAPISKGDIVAIKGGYIDDRAGRDRLHPSLESADIPIAVRFFIGPRRADEREGGMLFSNHSCDPNIGVQGQIIFVAMRDIQAGEELSHDWATTDDDTYEEECHCGASNCRKVITGQDWRRKDLQEKYRDYMSWYLQRKITQEAAEGEVASLERPK
jgi:SET domain-containing protein